MGRQDDRMLWGRDDKMGSLGTRQDDRIGGMNSMHRIKATYHVNTEKIMPAGRSYRRSLFGKWIPDESHSGAKPTCTESSNRDPRKPG